MTLKHDLTKLFPFILAMGLLIGIISNVIDPQNIKASCLIIISCIIIWYLTPYFKAKTNSFNHQTVTKMIWIGITFIFIIQLIVLHFLPATIYHDPFRVLYQAERLSRDRYTWNSSTYFWRYPNNVPLTFLLSKWLKLTMIFHLSTNTSLHILSLGLLDGFILTTLNSIRRISHHNSGVLATLLFFIISPFSYTYYLQVFYSDLPILVCLMLCFTILTKWETFSKVDKISNAFLMFFLILIGQLLKPNLIVLAVAVVLTMLILQLRDRKQLVKFFLPLTVILLGFVATIPTKAIINNTVNFTVNTKYELPTCHWIWMSYNPKSNGTYVGADVKKITQLPTKAARQQYIKHSLPKRIEALGLKGVIKRWVLKTGVLLNVSHIQKSYTGGYIEAPPVYQRYQVQISLIGSLIMRVGFIVIDGIALIKCLRLFVSKEPSSSPVMDLTILLAVGYLAFHTLIWEAESRYGQPLLPLLLIMAAFPINEVQTSLNIYRQRNRNLLITGALLMTTFVFITESKPLIENKAIIVAGQRSQLSLQYRARPTLLQPNQTIRQDITLNHTATKLSISVPRQTSLNAKLISLDHQKSYPLRHEATNLVIRKRLASGRYRISLANNLPIPQQVELVKTQNFKLAPHQLSINGQHFKYSSLIYKCSTRVY